MSTTIRQEKIDCVKNIEDRIKDSKLTVFLDYRGLSVSQMSELRNKFRDVDTKVNIFKNTFTRLALKSIGIDYPEQLLIGPTAIVTVEEDITQPAKVLKEYQKKYEVIKIRGGIFENKCVTIDLIKELAELPSREELIAKVIGSMKSPINGLVYTLSGQITNLINVLNSVKDKKLGGEK